MVTRDISRAVTIEQLKRQYNLDNKQMKQAIEQSKTNLIKVENELNGYIDSTTKELKKIQDQVDGNITTWFFSGVPTLENNPAVEWVEEKEKNKCILYSTHYMEEAENICDKIVMINKGKVIATGSPKEIKKNTNTTNLRDAFFALIGGDHE